MLKPSRVTSSLTISDKAISVTATSSPASPLSQNGQVIIRRAHTCYLQSYNSLCDFIERIKAIFANDKPNPQGCHCVS